jgi:hypothetical protein
MDEWDKDPAVQAMRRVFSGMEACLVQIPGEIDHFPV